MSSKQFAFGRLPIHVLSKIAQHLDFRDLLTLSAVYRLLRHQMAKHIWPAVQRLSYPEICGTNTTIISKNVDADNDVDEGHAQCRLNVTQFLVVVAKCGPHLRELNFAFCRRERQNALENESCSLEGCARVDEGIWNMLDRCPKLELLDLSAVRIRSRDLITIGRCVGRTLKVIELAKSPYDHPTDMDVDCFSQLLCFCIKLESLSVSRFFTQPQFSYREVAPTLRKIQARFLNGAQLAEVLARTGGCLQDLRTSIMGEDEPAEQQVSQQQLDQFFETLSIKKISERQPLELNFCPMVCRSLTRLECSHVGDEQRVQLMDSIFRNRLTALQQLRIICANFSRYPFADSGAIQNLTNLTVTGCTTIDDGLLELVAAQGRLEQLRLVVCPNVTMGGFAVILRKCQKIRLFCGDEQLCDTLLELVFDVMDQRMQGRMPNDLNAERPYAAFGFEFLRISRQQNHFLASWPTADWHNEASVQSSSQNVHPWVSFHAYNKRRSSGLFF